MRRGGVAYSNKKLRPQGTGILLRVHAGMSFTLRGVVSGQSSWMLCCRLLLFLFRDCDVD